MQLYAGIDLHSNNLVVAIVDEKRRRLFKKRLANDLGLLLRVLEPYREELVAVAVESTYNSGTGWWTGCRRRATRSGWSIQRPSGNTRDSSTARTSMRLSGSPI